MCNRYHNLMRFLVLVVSVAALGVISASGTASGSSVKSHPAAVPQREYTHSSNVCASPGFPTLYGVQQTGKVNAAFDAFACFGLGFSGLSASVPDWPFSSFEAPAGSGTDYLFGGAIWVGGIVNGDTIVSVGTDGWQNVGDIYPPQYTSSNHIGSVTQAEPVGDYAFRAECSDTAHQGITYPADVISGSAYQPLQVNVVTRSEIWHGAPRDNCVLYDVVITNIGQQTIHNGYVGLFMDGDVGSLADQLRSVDDVTGSIRDHGIAYIADNDGNFSQGTPALGAFACKFLWNSWGATDTSYNWWVSNLVPALDFGPRLRAGYREFSTAGGMGTPEGDANKYYLMSHPEWDYDQVVTGTTGLSDTLWTFPSAPLAQMVSKGYDTRLLLSLGHFELPPDSSIRFIFATYIADSIHTNADNGKNITDPNAYNPDAYLAGLNLADLLRNAGVADTLAGLLQNPEAPVQGIHLAYHGHDTVVVSWDDWCSSNIDGYNIYLTTVPDSAVQASAVLPPSVRALDDTPYAQIGREHSFLITGGDPDLTYSCTVAHRINSTVGAPSSPLTFRFDSGSPTGVTTTDPNLPKTFGLAQNYPNPFNPSTTIKFSLPRAAHVTLDIYNVLGQKVNSLVEANLPAGEHRVVWSGTNSGGRPVSSGIYFYRLHAGDQIATRTMMLLK